MAKKSSRIEVARRIEQIAQLMVDGYTTTKIRRYSSQKWSLSARQTDVYIKRARLQIEEEMSANFSDKLNLAIRVRRDRYNETKRRIKSIESGDLPANRKLYFIHMFEKQASDELAHIEKMEGLLINKVDHTTGGDKMFTQPAQIVFQNPDDGEDDNSTQS